MAFDFECRYTGQTVLAIGAHPDDVELGMGGTAARLARAGARVVMAVACVPNDYETRVSEARKAADILGCESRVLVGDGCRRVEDVKSYQLVERIDALIEELRPAAMFSHGCAEVHKDHVLVHQACLASQRRTFLDFFCFNPTSSRPALLDFRPQVFVDISETVELKMRAISAHESQFERRGLEIEFVRDLGRAYGLAAGVPHAEGLELVRMKLDFRPRFRPAPPRRPVASPSHGRDATGNGSGNGNGHENGHGF
jgi:LmbE family N-acetylglucosaminyl deacetylase